ncbi:MAG: hypothetical protein ACKODB_03245, partial [Betaproteobacteria bacterium]
RAVARGGAVPASDAPTIDWGASTLERQLTPGKSLTLDSAQRQLDLQARARLQLGEAQLNGEFLLSLERVGAADRWKLAARDASFGLAVGGIGLSLSDVQGTLYLNANGTREGSVTGVAALSGVPALTLQGNLSAAFDASGR